MEIRLLQCDLCEQDFDGRLPHFEEQVIEQDGSEKRTVLCKGCERMVQVGLGREILIAYHDLADYRERGQSID